MADEDNNIESEVTGNLEEKAEESPDTEEALDSVAEDSAEATEPEDGAGPDSETEPLNE